MRDEYGIRIPNTKRLQKRLQHGTAIFVNECRLKGLLKEKNPVSNDADVYNAIRDQVNYAQKLHPKSETLIEAANLLVDRAQDCLTDTLSSDDPNHLQRTARRAIQVAALAIRMLQDHDLPLPKPNEPWT